MTGPDEVGQHSAGIVFPDRHVFPDISDAADQSTPTTQARRPIGSRMRPTDLFDEALRGISARPARLVLTMTGTVVGIAALVATLGLGQTAAGQIAQRFDEVAATRIVVSAANSTFAPDGATRTTLPWDAAVLAARLSGVAGAATVSTIDLGTRKVSGVALVDPSSPGLLDISAVATSPDLLAVEGGQVVTGRFFDAGHDAHADRVVVLGAAAAAQLNINRVDSRPALFIGDTSFAVIGIIDGMDRRTELADAVILPNGTAATYLGLTAPAELDIRTVIGAAQQVGAQAPVAVSPNHPEQIDAQVPPKPGNLSTSVRGDVNSLFLAFGAVAVIVGGLGIANVTLLSVIERTGEIGLRRALGARRRHIAAQFLLESAVTGLLGGLIGAALGVAVVAASAAKEWTPILDFKVAVLAPIAGGVIGLLAGAYPAVRAALTEPITALRRAG